MKKFDLNGGKQLFDQTANLVLQKEAFSIGSKEYQPNETEAFFTFTLANSWPNVNANLVCFHANTIEKSYQTANHSPINIEHNIEGNGILLLDGNQIIGHMIDSWVEDNDDGGKSIVVAGVLYKRLDKAKDIITDIASGGSDWKISMEVLYKPAESGFMLADETYIPLESADEGIVNAYLSGSQIYNGQKYGFMAGGLGESDDPANFWGGALTMTPADEDSIVRTMVATRLPKALIGGQVPKVILMSDGNVESTRLLIDGTEIQELADVDFSSWLGYDETWLQWTTKAKDIGGVMETSRYTLIASEIIGDTGMNKIKEFLEGLPTAISEAVTAAKTENPEKDVDVDAIVAEAVAEKASEFEGYLSPDEVDAQASELADQKIKDRDALAAKIKERSEKASEAGVLMTDERMKEIATIEEGKLDEWIADQLKSVDEMVASIEEKHQVSLSDDTVDSLKKFGGVASDGFKGFASAFAMVLEANPHSAGDGGSGESKDDNKPTGLG